MDSRGHFRVSYGIHDISGMTRKEGTDYLATLRKRIETENPVKPKPSDIEYER